MLTTQSIYRSMYLIFGMLFGGMGLYLLAKLLYQGWTKGFQETSGRFIFISSMLILMGAWNFFRFFMYRPKKYVDEDEEDEKEEDEKGESK